MKTNAMRGFTLIELMLVVLIVGLMVLVASPFTSAWSNSASVTKYEGVINYAISLAKTAAQRNEAGVDIDGKVTALCVSAGNDRLYVEQASIVAGAIVEADCTLSSEIIYQADLPSNLTVTRDDDTAFEMSDGDGLCFNNRGLQVITAVADSCDASTGLKITVGNESADIEYF